MTHPHVDGWCQTCGCPDGECTGTRRRRLVVVVDAELVDPEWTDTTLIDNASMYFGAMIERAEAEHMRDPQTYTLSDDATVYLEDDYLADLAEIAALPEDQQQVLREWVNMQPRDRSRMFRSLPVPSK